MKVVYSEIEGLIELYPTVFGDQRGYFYESYNQELFLNLGIPDIFVQDNQSLSHKGVLRGLHFQIPPHQQGKLVRVISGAALDIAVDIRKNSATYGKWHMVELNSDKKNLFWIPPGFAHGFLTLADNTIFAYKCSAYYNKDSEDGIMWNDRELGINWPLNNPQLSEKDTFYIPFSDFQSPF